MRILLHNSFRLLTLSGIIRAIVVRRPVPVLTSDESGSEAVLRRESGDGRMPEDFGRLSDDQLRAIGRVTANSTALEFMMKIWIGSLTGLIGNELMALVGAMDFQPLANALSNIGRLKTLDDPETWDRLSGAIAKARTANDRRNIVIHSFWIATSSGNAVGWKFPRGTPKFYQPEAREMDLPALNSIADEIADAAQQIGDALVEFEKKKGSRP